MKEKSEVDLDVAVVVETVEEAVIVAEAAAEAVVTRVTRRNGLPSPSLAVW